MLRASAPSMKYVLARHNPIISFIHFTNPSFYFIRSRFYKHPQEAVTLYEADGTTLIHSIEMKELTNWRVEDTFPEPRVHFKVKMIG
jgi:hypothetical protein